MELISLKKLNEVFLQVNTEPGLKQELADYFTFYAEGYQFMPAFRNKMWDGKIRLFDARNNTIYAGLLSHIEQFAQDRDYEVQYHDSSVGLTEEFSLQEGKEFVDTLKLPVTIRDYQLNAFVHAVRKKRCLLLSPTASGKSLIIYTLIRYYEGKKALIIVPTTSLVSQLYGDFDYYGKTEGWESKHHVHYIMAGRDKQSDMPITISTWQSLYKMPKQYFDQYDVIVGDECHLFKAKSLTSIMTKLVNAKYRFGTTGTLDDTQTHKLILEGLFGRVKKVTTTKDLIDKNQLAKFDIKAITLKYPEKYCKEISKKKYHEEIDFLVGCNKRNAFIRNLAVSLEGNTLVLFQYVEKHGNLLHTIIKDKVAKGRKVFYVYGGTDTELREQIRAIVETEKDSIIVASYGVYSTGVNIKNLHNIIFSHPGKSKIRVLQSIGRGLRMSESKNSATLYDIVDDLSYKAHKNFAVKHFVERYKYYMQEKFPTKIYKVDLKF
jgi:superfamily II DNA or RNA helicase